MPYTAAAKKDGPRFTGEEVIEPFDYEAWRREVQEVFSRPPSPLPPVKPKPVISYALGDDPFTGDTLRQKMRDDCRNYGSSR